MNRSTRALVSLSVASVTAAALIFGATNRAEAFPPFKDKEGKKCVYCHVAPAGGKRNYRGLFYKANSLSFKNFDDAAEAKKAGVEVGPEPEPKPKSWTAPAGASDNGGGGTATPEKKLTVAEARAKVKVTDAALKKSPRDAAAKKAHAAALADLAHAVMLDQSIPPAKRYPEALSLTRKALALDPTNKQALADKKAIEDAYKSMGRPIPQGR